MAQRKLLLADDSITIQKVVNLTFADEGIEVITVGDGDSAMEKMSEINPDLVMADVNMPGLNGYQICERIRQTENLKKTPVILLVGSFEPFDEDEARRVGADDFLTKPFQSIRQLVTKVTELLERSTQNGETSEDFQTVETLSNFTPETAAYVAPESAPSEITETAAQYGDTGMDDEMIQSSAAGFNAEEPTQFETREVDDLDRRDAAKTQPLSSEDLRQFSYGAGETEETAENEETAAPDSEEENLTSENLSQTETQTEEPPMSQPAPALTMDEDDDILEIPFDDEEEEWEEPEAPQAAVSAGQPSTESVQAFAESAPASSESVSYEQSAPQQVSMQEENPQLPLEAAETPASTQLSAELIDAIAQRVVEKLSDQAVKDVAWEVVPQMADLIIKKMAEEKLKE